MKLVRLLLFAFVSLCAVLIGFVLLDPTESIGLYIKIAYPTTVLLYGLLFFSFYKSGYLDVTKLKALVSRRIAPLTALFLLLSVFFIVHEPYGMKTLADEALIASTSQSLHLERKPLFIWRAYNVESCFTPVEQYLDKRPIAFSTLLSFIHDLFGYRLENAYVLNTLMGLGLLALIGYWGYQTSGRMGSILGMMLMAGLPLLSYYAHGAGFDVFHILMILVTIGCGVLWYQKSDDWSLVSFVLSGVLLCFTRYEAAMYVLPIGIVILWKWVSDRRLQLPWLLLLVPLIVTLIPLHQNVFDVNENFWELEFRPEADAVFALKYFYPNLASAIRFLGDFSDVYPNSPWVTLFGFFSFALLVGTGILRLKDHLRTNPNYVVWIAFCATMFFHFLLMMVYFYGQFDYEPLHRFALPICLFFVICSIWALELFKSDLLKKLIVGGACLGFLFYSIPVASKHRYSDSNWTSRHSMWVEDYAADHRDDNYMVVAFNPIYWILEGVSAIPFGQAIAHPDRVKFQLDHAGFEKILLIERIVRDEVTGVFGNADKVQLLDGFQTRLIYEDYVDQFYKMRVSEIVDVDVDVVMERAGEFEQRDLLVNPDEKFEQIKPDSMKDKPGLAEFYYNLP